MKIIVTAFILFVSFSNSYLTSLEDSPSRLVGRAGKVANVNLELTSITDPLPALQDINLKVGIVDESMDGICFRTKTGDLTENAAVSIVNSLYGPQTVLNAKVSKKLEEKCSRYASETTDRNPGENYYYSLVLTDNVTDEYLEVFGIGIIEPGQPVRIIDNLARYDLNNDGKDEFFRRCEGNEGILLAIWTGKPLKGKQIWHSFYYLDYDTEPNCRKKDSEGIDSDNGGRER